MHNVIDSLQYMKSYTDTLNIRIDTLVIRTNTTLMDHALEYGIFGLMIITLLIAIKIFSE